MIWQIILLIIIFLVIIPIPIKFKLNFNILKLSGEFQLRFINFINYKIRVRFRGQYVYITRNEKARREKLTSSNFNVMFVMQLVRQLYFRIVLNSLHFVSDVGYYNDAFVTAVGTGVVDIVSKSLYAKILHNKKSAHIFIFNEAKYNRDCLNLKIEGNLSISIFDIIYSIINSLWSIKGEKYETRN